MANAAEVAMREKPLLHAMVAEPADHTESSSKKWQELSTALARHSGEKMLVALTGYPDPDNIASGLTHRFLAKAFDIETTLLCFHEVSH